MASAAGGTPKPFSSGGEEATVKACGVTGSTSTPRSTMIAWNAWSTWHRLSRRPRPENPGREILGRHLRRRKRATIPDPATPPAPDLIGRDFTATAPDQRWCGDITYLRVGGGWLYPATVIDIATRRLIDWSINTHMRASLITDALDAAIAARGGRVNDVIFHSDRGARYVSSDFADACQRHGIRRSMGRIGSSYDNALAEAFFASLKRELDVDHRRRATETDARRDVFRRIAFYNHRRRHSALGHLSPADYETNPHTGYPAPDRGITRCPHPGGISTEAET
ncbi:IS3 family transposase [Micromonospora carbonacea]|uniref:IS3 family transposase n=1 Tax=Micromonospora carbonacea TaxID=47853 RepID=UPI00371E6C7E